MVWDLGGDQSTRGIAVDRLGNAFGMPRVSRGRTYGLNVNAAPIGQDFEGRVRDQVWAP